jgi:branched-chain amino acid transport system substrate-binding protein
VQVWAQAVESTKSLDRKTVAEAIRGKPVKGTVFGDVQFLPNGQMQPHYVVFKVIDGKNAKLEALQ